MSSHTALLGGQIRDSKLLNQPSRPSSSVPQCYLVAVGVFALIAVLFTGGSSLYPALSSSTEANNRPTVTIAQGKLLGYKTKAGPYLFNNIPFAQPPVGRLRWLPPQLPPPSWTGVRDAQTVPNMCVQPGTFMGDINANATGDEDCLYLNVYTKQISVVDEKGLSPVLVFVHGGSSIDGWSSDPLYDHQKLVSNRDVVAVTVNYRLNVFGYLALDVLTSNQFNVTGRLTSGNYGLLDNIAALQWVKANIAAFGGDPNRVTIYGQSTGATNVVCLYMSPLARGLFHAVLSLSASPVLKGDLAFASKQNEPFLSLSACDKKTSEAETLDCIYALSPEVVLPSPSLHL